MNLVNLYFWTYFSFGKNQFFERSEVKPQVGEAETHIGVSQNDAGHVFDDVDNDDVTSDDITAKSTTKSGLNNFKIFQELCVFLVTKKLNELNKTYFDDWDNSN